MIRLGVLGSTRGTDLQAILDAIDSKLLESKLSVVISNKKTAFILERANKHKIPSYSISHKNINRETFDRKITKLLKKHKVDLVLLIGFMRILSKSFCQDWKGKILNVHPSLLPKYAGRMDTNVHEEVLKNKDKETGCTIHFVTDEVDCGPIFIQKKCPVKPEDTVDSLKRRVQKLEGEAFLEAIPLFETKYISKHE
tara:strand:+ start:123 stop:713 length:591 start_codon:yes stop_codon:yes gene_type:complete